MSSKSNKKRIAGIIGGAVGIGLGALAIREVIKQTQPDEPIESNQKTTNKTVLNIFELLNDQAKDVNLGALVSAKTGELELVAHIMTYADTIDDVQLIYDEDRNDVYALIKTTTKLNDTETNHITYAYHIENNDNEESIQAEFNELLAQISPPEDSLEDNYHVHLFTTLDDDDEMIGDFIDEYPVIVNIHHADNCHSDDPIDHDDDIQVD